MTDFKQDLFKKDKDGNIDAPAGWVHRDPDEAEVEDLIDFVADEFGFLYGALDHNELSKYSPQGDVWDWEYFQEEYINCNKNYCSNKARQVGMSSGGMAAKAFARGMLTQNRNYTAIFTSYKKEEAINKVNFVRQFLGALPPRFKKKIVRDPRQLIEWENVDGTRSKIISHAQRPIRGSHGDIFLDELAFYQYGEDIYESALNAIGMMGGNIDIVSTPFGKKGIFYDIFTDEHNYPNFVRRKIMWWDCKRYLKRQTDAFLAFARANAPKCETSEERVYKFGNEKIIRLFEDARDVESFQQELEGLFVDEQASFISKELIQKVMFPDGLSAIDDYQPNENDFDIPIEEALENVKFPILEKYPDVRFKTYDELEDLYDAVQRGEVSHNLVAGADLGTTRHSTDFVILEEIQDSDGSTLQAERFRLSRREWSLPSQQEYFKKVLLHGFVKKLRMDCTGVGMQTGQYLEERFDSDQFKALQMGGSSKKQETEMVNLRARMENFGIALERDRDKIQQLHNIQRIITPAGNTSYRADDNQKHHSDYAWALAFASLAGTPWGEEPVTFDLDQFDEVSARVSDQIGKNSKFVDDFNKDVLRPGKNEFDGDMLGIDEQISMDEFSPGKFNKNWNK